MSVDRYKRSLSVLQQQHEAMQQQLDALSSNHRKLQLRNSIVSSWCEAFSALLGAQLSDASVADNSLDLLADMLVEESQLMQQLGLPGAAGDAAASHHPPSTVKKLLKRPILPGAEHMTLREVAQRYKTSVQESSILLHALEAQLGSRADIEQEIIDIWESFAHIAVSIAAIGRPELGGLMVTLDLRTFEPSAEADQQAQRYSNLVPQLRLSDEQLETLLVGTETAASLLVGLQQQRLAVQAQVAAFDSSGSSSGSTSGAADVEGRLARIWDKALPGSSSRQEQLEEQQQRLQRVERMLQKEHVFRAVIALWFGDVLGYVKCAKLHCMTFPFPTRPLVLCQVIKKWAEAREQQAGDREQQAEAEGQQAAA